MTATLAVALANLLASTPAATATPPDLEREIATLRAQTTVADAPAPVWIKLGATLMQQARHTLDERLYLAAEDAYQQARTLDPTNAEALLGLAWTSNARHQFDEGASWARKALAIDPRLARAHALLGDGAVECGRYDEAFTHFQTALDLAPNLSSFSRAAHLLWLTGDPQGGMDLMQRAIDSGGAFSEHTAWCRAELALMRFHAGDLPAALELAARADAESPRNPRILAIQGRLLRAAGEDDRAELLFQRSVAIHPQPEALVGLAELAEARNAPAEAEHYRQLVVTLHRTAHDQNHEGGVEAHPHGSSGLALFLANHDRDRELALREAERAYECFPNIYAADALAWCYYKCDRLDEARRTMRDALRWNTPDASLFFHAGMIESRLGSHDAAREHLRRALHLNARFHPADARTAAETLARLSEGSED